MSEIVSKDAQNFALLVDAAASSYATLELVLVKKVAVSVDPNISVHDSWNFYANRAQHEITRSLIWQFISNANKAYRIADKSTNCMPSLVLERRNFLKLFRELSQVRNIGEHHFDANTPANSKKVKASPKTHLIDGLNVSVDETSIVLTDNGILIGSINIRPLGKEMLKIQELLRVA